MTDFATERRRPKSVGTPRHEHYYPGQTRSKLELAILEMVLVRAKSVQWTETCRAPRGQPACEQYHTEQNRRGSYKYSGNMRRHAVEQRFDEPSTGNGRRESDHDAGQRDDGSLAHNQPHNAPGAAPSARRTPISRLRWETM